jgi:hypothetical protein
MTQKKDTFYKISGVLATKRKMGLDGVVIGGK